MNAYHKHISTIVPTFLEMLTYAVILPIWGLTT